MNNSGILLVDKEKNSTSFHLVALLRKLTGIEKIGHAGTLDPFATGLMVMLIGKQYTTKSDQFLCADKEYVATLHLGIVTDTYDIEGVVTERKDHIPSDEEILLSINAFQGKILQIPPMYSAKKIQGKKLYDLARQGITVERKPVPVEVEIEKLSYNYPYLQIRVKCSKGTYIRSLAYDMGQFLGCGAHLCQLSRTRSGMFSLADAASQQLLTNKDFDIASHLKKV